MLIITVPAGKLWDARKNDGNGEFVSTKETVLALEHSLVSISKWEAKWHIPFIGDDKKTNEQTIDYVRHMTLTQNVDPNVYLVLTKDNLKHVSEYVENKMTATWFSEPAEKKGAPKKKEIITSELIYYWMIALEIPFEAQKWHLNRLLTLIKVCNIKAKEANKKPSKKPSAAALTNRAQINAARKKALGTSG